MANNSSQSCRPCMLNAICLGGDNISPKPGFWRASNKSTLITECPVSDSCLGLSKQNISNPENLIKGECLEGHWGALCYECKKGLARFKAKSLCKPCDEQPLIYIKLTLSAIFLIAYILFQANIFSRMELK